MTNKHRKYRKTPSRALGDSPSDVVCRRGDLRSKSTETTAFGEGTSSKKQKKKTKKGDAGQRQRSQHAKSSKRRRSFVTLKLRKISSVSFFIPLDSHDCGYQEVPVEKIVDWSNLLCYPCNKSAKLTSFPDELSRKVYYYKPTILPELKLKCRTVSESSTNSDDSFICFEDDDKHDDSFICFEDDDDGFICFEDDDTHDDSFICFENDDTHDDSFICFEDDDSPDGPCECSSVQSNSRASDRNDKASERDKSSSKENSKKKKRVSFVDNSQLVTVRWIVAWNYAYRAARVSPWMTMARDAKRFKQRIQSLEPILSPILNPEHRARIWETRMLTEE